MFTCMEAYGIAEEGDREGKRRDGDGFEQLLPSIPPSALRLGSEYLPYVVPYVDGSTLGLV